MRLDLTIMPLRNARELVGNILAYDRLSFDRDYRIFAQIADVNWKSAVPNEGLGATVRTFPLPPSVQVEMYQDEGLITTRENSYGEEMVYATAREMKKVKLPEDASPKNRAILSYISALEKITPIILEWR